MNTGPSWNSSLPKAIVVVVFSAIYDCLRNIYHYLRSVYHYHPRQRFLNSIEIRFKTALGLWKALAIPDSVIHRVFHIYVRRSVNDAEVVKLPNGHNDHSCGLINKLRNSETFEKYRRALQDSKLDPSLKDHCVTVKRVRRDGGYTSEYVEGINLAHFREQILRDPTTHKLLHADLLAAIKQLIQDLTAYHHQHGELIGDWPFNNLVFSSEKRSIVNVDAEGFFTWFGATDNSHLPLITANLCDLALLIELLHNPAPDDSKIVDSLKILDEVRRSNADYNGKYFLAGYHSLQLGKRSFRGQRECSERLAQVPFDFQNKTVLDLGCNCGGMLHALAKTIKAGCGVDFNPKCVNAANAIKSFNKSANLEFYTLDLDRDDLSLIKSFLLGEAVDICFLLSVCMWLQRWREVVQTASTLADTLLFESNGSPEQQNEQAALLHCYYKRVQLLADTSTDDFLQGARKLYFCHR
jgi:hypothetical protein